MANKLRYPIGIQAFEKIRSDGYLYIDKTAFLHELRHSSGSTHFLSRPRRFGKSLLLSTMQAYREGRRDLFKGLAVDAMESDWEPRPVVRLDLSTVKTRDVLQFDIDRRIYEAIDRGALHPDASRRPGLCTAGAAQ